MATSETADTEQLLVGTAPLVNDPAAVLATLLAVLALIFWLAAHPTFGRLFKVVPTLVFCYFVPTALTTLGVLPAESPLYTWVKAFVLPAALLLLIISLDLPAIVRLGPKAVIMLLAGTAGVVIGGPFALWTCRHILTGSWKLPPDAWQGMAALSGSWIGGGANFVAIGEIAKTSDAMLATMVIPDVVVANIWMGVLLYLSAHQRRIDNWTGANTSAIDDLKLRMKAFQERVNRVAAMPELMMILALGFAGSWLSYRFGLEIAGRIREYAYLSDSDALKTLARGFGPPTWKYIIVTTIGIVLSFTRARNLEGAGASKIGSVMIYLLVACIGASANFRLIVEAPGFIVAGFMWMAVHIVILLAVGKLIRAPIFFVAVGSQSNIGGAASAPVVAAAFHPALAPVGALLAVAGYVLGTYAGLLCMYLLQSAAGPPV
ncbi:MAG: DUF819 family protein [Phycisphaerae bacterium]|jgi:uncharacterized membrane protein